MLYQQVKSAVCFETGVSEEQILHSSKEACVDARYIMVHLLSQWMTDEEISRVTGLSRTCANKIRNSFQRKMSKFSVRCAYQDILRSLPTEENLLAINIDAMPRINHNNDTTSPHT